MGRTKKKYTKKELEFFRNLIEQKRENLQIEIDYLKDTAMSSTIKEASGDHSSYSFHMADQGTDSMEREKAFLFASREKQYLDHLNEALKRIDAYEYGVCAKCGNLISEERLKAVPITTQCVACKKRSG